MSPWGPFLDNHHIHIALEKKPLPIFYTILSVFYLYFNEDGDIWVISTKMIKATELIGPQWGPSDKPIFICINMDMFLMNWDKGGSAISDRLNVKVT